MTLKFVPYIPTYHFFIFSQDSVEIIFFHLKIGDPTFAFHLPIKMNMPHKT